MLRYTVYRLMIFFGALLAFWLAGLRGPDQQILLLLLSAAASVVLSFFLLRRQREQFAEWIAARVEQRAETRRQVAGADEDAEDAETQDHTA